MFDPSVGRWMSEDPRRFKDGNTNLADFVHNNPTNATDPSGLKLLLGLKGPVEILENDDNYKTIVSDPLFPEDKRSIVIEMLRVWMKSPVRNRDYQFSNMDVLRNHIKLRLNIIETAEVLADKIKNKTMEMIESGNVWLDIKDKEGKPLENLTKLTNWKRHITLGGLVPIDETGRVLAKAGIIGLQVQENLSASVALGQLLGDTDGQVVHSECFSACVIAYHGGLRRLFGDKGYDRLFTEKKPLYINGTLSGMQGFIQPFNFDRARAEKGEYTDDLIPGDQRGFYNPDFTDPVYRYENTIYVGNNKYFAFPFGIVSRDDLYKELRKFSKSKKIVDCGYSRQPKIP